MCSTPPIVWAAVLFVLYPSMPWGTGYFHGRAWLFSARRGRRRSARRSWRSGKTRWTGSRRLSFAEIKQGSAADGGRAAPAAASRSPNNCQPCHGAGGGGQSGLPGAGGRRLDLGRHARRHPADHHPRHPQRRSRRSRERRCRASAPTASLKPAEIQQVADYVWTTLYGHPDAGQDVSAGAKMFADNCAVCHGEQGRAIVRWARRGLPATCISMATTGQTIVAQVNLAAHGRDAELGHAARSGDDQGRDAVRAFLGRRRIEDRPGVTHQQGRTQLQLQREAAGDHLYANRVQVYPKSVHGPVRRIKWAVLIVCLTIYYLLPWLRWHRGVRPARPGGAVVDISHERFYFFNLEFWPQDIY